MISVVEQTLQNLLLQKQTINSQINELSLALKELEHSEDSYRLLGNILIKVEPKSLREQLTKDLDSLNLRLKSIEKQEESLTQRLQALQKEFLSQINKNKGEQNGKKRGA
ncbi:MAG: prefoldin beta subunit [Candidatus Woesearchaeota archaeon]|nr:prefoldin beta subunit [Candidatus Woesearchaeota archaeon]MDN5327410.1 prefoldin beta subunit [Candidatus Woesearchaeota archaeon]